MEEEEQQSFNPYDFLQLMAAMSASRKNPTQSGINRLFMPELGVVSGSYYGTEGATDDQQNAAVLLDLAPDILRADELGKTDPDNIYARITRQIVYEKKPVWEVRRMIQQYIVDASADDPTIDVSSTELMDFANKIQTQNDKLKAYEAKAGVSKKSDIFSEAGLPSFESRFAPEDLAPDYFRMYADQERKRAEEFRKIQPANVTARNQAAKYLDEQQKLRKKVSSPMDPIEQIGSLFRGIGAGFSGKDVGDAMEQRVGAKQLADPEQIRFGNIAQRIVDTGPQNKDLSSKRADLVRRQQSAETVRDLVASGLSKKAEAAGYTPLMIALLKRAQFTGLGDE
jgi:hypothetical protein